MKLLLLCGLFTEAVALFFGGGGGGGCCCGCGTPQPPSCGCGGQSICPPPQACPACAAPVCPPPPQAICPQVQPIYIPSSSCSGGSCGGGCSGGSCGGGSGYLGGGFSASPGGGYATSGAGGYGGGSISSGGAGYAPQPLPAPASAFSNSGSSSSGFAAPVSSGGNEAGYSQGTGGGYQEHVAAAVQADDPKSAINSIESGPVPPGPLPSLSQAFRNPQICEPKIKYVVIRAKKIPGRPGDEMEEEAEEIERPPALEATASPLDPKEVSDELLHGEDELGDADSGIQARGATTLSDAKCNSKPLRDLIMENIVRDDALASKRQIHEASIKRFPEHTVDVVCSTTGFTYLVSTTEHCESQRDNVICFVYKRPI